MALRQFRDRHDVTWQVWAITGERQHNSTRPEGDFRPLLDGWLVFESEDGSQKRRHCPIPDGWASASAAELEWMCETAEVVHRLRSRVSVPAGKALPTGGPVESREAEREVRRPNASSRSFLYPGGRVWMAAEVPADGSPARTRSSVLRFTAGRRSLDLEDFPDDWARQSDADLADLLYRSFPRSRFGDESSPYHRRRDDATVDESPGQGPAAQN